jgi:hypothetical protein
VALFPLSFVTLLIAGKLFAAGPYRALIAEDGIIEYATFVVYLLASGFAVALALDLYRQRQTFSALLYCLLAQGCSSSRWKRSAGANAFSILTTRPH